MNIPDKKQLRSIFLAKRKTLTTSEVAAASYLITANTSSLIKALTLDIHSNIALYHPINNEPNILNIRDSLSYNYCLPCTQPNNKELIFKQFDGNLTKQQFAIMEPSSDAIIVVPDVILVPLVACDTSGARVGYGMGHFDVTLSKMLTKPILIGIAYDWQLVDKIEIENHDVNLDYIVTEQKIIDCKKSLY